MVQFEVVRTSSVAESGTSDATVQQIESLILTAANEWARYFAEVDVTITIELTIEPEDEGVLATGGGGFFLLGTAGTGQSVAQSAAAAELLSGSDPSPDAVDITLSFNADVVEQFFFDDDPTTSADLPFNQFDAYTIILHELGHGFGFLNFTETLADVLDLDSPITIFDNFRRFEGDTPFFTGSAARAVFGADVPLTVGNSSHLGNPGGPGQELTGFGADVLQASISTGKRLEISSLDIAVLSDLGIPIRKATGAGDTLSGFNLEADYLDGLEGDDTLEGLSGNDTLIGGVGSDTLIGGTGADRFVFTGNDAQDVVSDFSFADTLDFTGIAGLSSRQSVIDAASDTSIGGISGVLIDTGAGTSVFITGISLASLENASIVTGALAIGDSFAAPQIGTAASEMIAGTAARNAIDGGAGDDFLNGSAGDDSVAGGAGNDSIFAGPGDEGDDIFIGGAGNDVIGGGNGDDLIIGGGFDDGATAQTTANIAGGSLLDDGGDTLFGGAGNDTLIGGSFLDEVDNGIFDNNSVFGSTEAVRTGLAANTIFAGPGDDFLFGASGGDTLGGGTGDDVIDGDAGDDVIFGGPGDTNNPGINDAINAGDGDDTVFASGGNDDVFGGAGNDLLFSGPGNDTVAGGAGADTLFGGADDDFFVGGDGADTFAFVAGNGDDVVLDFSVFSDTLDISDTVTDFQTIADLQAAASASVFAEQMGVLIDTGGGDSVFLSGLSLDDLASLMVVF